MECSEETKQKMSDGSRGKTHSEETLQKMRKPKSDDHKQKISDSKKGKPCPQIGHPRTLETRQKISDANKGKKMTPEQIKKSSDSKKGSIRINNGKKEKLVKPEFLQEFLNQGWKIGMTLEHTKNLSNTKKKRNSIRVIVTG